MLHASWGRVGQGQNVKSEGCVGEYRAEASRAGGGRGKEARNQDQRANEVTERGREDKPT